MIKEPENKVQSPPKPLRVVLIGDDYDLHRYGPVLRRLSVGLLDEVAELSILSLGNSKLLQYIPCPPVRLIIEERDLYQSQAIVTEQDRQVRVSRPGMNIFEHIWPKKRIHRLAEILKKYNPTLLHSLSCRQSKLTRKLSRYLNIPYAVSVLSYEHKNLSVSEKRCGQIMPCFSSLTREMRQNHPSLASRIHHTIIGTHSTESPCCFNHNDKLPHLFCSGPLEESYGISTLLYAAFKLATNGHKFHLTISGQGSAESSLRKLTSELRINDIVHFCDPLEHIIADNDAYKMFLQTVDIFIMPWTAKSWQPELTEAMGVGNAIVVAQGVDNDLIKNEKSALTFNPNDSNSLAEQLQTLLADKDYARQLASQCQNHIRKHFLASDMVNSLAKAYRQAVKIDL